MISTHHLAPHAYLVPLNGLLEAQLFPPTNRYNVIVQFCVKCGLYQMYCGKCVSESILKHSFFHFCLFVCSKIDYYQIDSHSHNHDYVPIVQTLITVVSVYVTNPVSQYQQISAFPLLETYLQSTWKKRLDYYVLFTNLIKFNT